LLLSALIRFYPRPKGFFLFIDLTLKWYYVFPMHDENILIEAGCSPAVIAHCRAVSRTAVSLAGKVKRVAVDGELVRLGGLFHDIGRARSHDIHHALAGVSIGRELGFSEPLLAIIERHIGAGITAPEAERLGLPKRDYLPITPEEKIVSYADNLTKGSEPLLFEQAMDRFRRILGPEHEGIGLLVLQHDEIQGWMR
jgi:uncharacterized protein